MIGKGGWWERGEGDHILHSNPRGAALFVGNWSSWDRPFREKVWEAIIFVESERNSVQDRVVIQPTGSLHIHVLVPRRTRDSFKVNNMERILSYLISQKGFGKVACTVRAARRGNTQPFRMLHETWGTPSEVPCTQRHGHFRWKGNGTSEKVGRGIRCHLSLLSVIHHWGERTSVKIPFLPTPPRSSEVT